MISSKKNPLEVLDCEFHDTRNKKINLTFFHISKYLVYFVYYTYDQIFADTMAANPKFDSRRGLIRIGSFSIFAIGGPVIFAGMGMDSLIFYIVALAIFRLITAVTVSELAKHYPSSSLFLYRISPLMMVASSITPWFSSYIIESSILLESTQQSWTE